MRHDETLPKQKVVVRWLALASASGAAITSGISLWLNDAVWLNISIVSSLLAVSCIAAFWHRIDAWRQPSPPELNLENHIQEVSGLRSELEQHKSLEAELKKSKLAAESAAMAKSEFLATMSHEIRTPLNGIIPLLDLLANTRLGKDQADILTTARNSADQMKRIVDDILDYSKLEANKLKLETTGLNIRDVVNSVVQMFKNQAEAKRLAIHVTIDPNLRLALRGDPVRLRQVLSNLLGNAIKFTARGSVTITVKPKSETRQHHILRFEVKDTGIGIAPENASGLFKAFSQADASTTRLYGGTGLGLVICKRIIDLMSGLIGVESQPGKGSTFWFEVPMLKAVGDSKGMVADLENAQTLLLSSDPILTGKFEKAGRLAGKSFTTAPSIFEAQKILGESVSKDGKTTLDLLIIDVNSGRQSAIQLQKALLSNPQFALLRIAMLNSPEATPLILEKNPRRWVIKRNTDITGLVAELNKLLATTAEEASDVQSQELEPVVNISAPDRPFTAGKSNGKVLLVEDNPVNLLVVQRLIQLTNFDCASAENGEVALELLQRQHFDLVLMDCQMPVLDGYRAAKAWRAIEAQRRLPRLPIIAITANAMAEDRKKCLDSGMDDYLSKPVDLKLLQQVMLKWVDRARQAAGTETMEMPTITAAPAETPPVQAYPAVGGGTPPLDMEIVQDLKDMMGSGYQELICIYLEDSPKLLAQIQTAIADGDSAALVTPAHTLRSSSANLGALRVSEIAKRMEKSARAGDVAGPAAETGALTAEFGRVQAALAALLA